MNNSILKNIKREDSLERIQKYVLEQTKNQDISKEMFKLFRSVIELGKEVRISIKENDSMNSETKIIDIFFALVSICNNLNINLFDALTEKEPIANRKLAKWI